MLPAADRPGNDRANDGREPEQPQLRNIRGAGKQSRTRASRRIDRRVGDRDREEMTERQAKPDVALKRPAVHSPMVTAQ